MPPLARSLWLAAGLLLSAAAPGFAAPPASPATKAFLANLVPNVDFLDRSSRFALDNSKSARLRAYARSEAREQTRVADALYDWTQGGAPQMVASAAPPVKGDLDRTPTASTKPGWGLLSRPDAAADPRLPRGQEDLDSLEGLTGPDFDAPYKEGQADALAQVEADYRAYLAKGDDPALLALAKRELPKIVKRRKALGKI